MDPAHRSMRLAALAICLSALAAPPCRPDAATAGWPGWRGNAERHLAGTGWTWEWPDAGPNVPGSRGRPRFSSRGGRRPRLHDGNMASRTRCTASTPPQGGSGGTHTPVPAAAIVRGGPSSTPSDGGRVYTQQVRTATPRRRDRQYCGSASWRPAGGQRDYRVDWGFTLSAWGRGEADSPVYTAGTALDRPPGSALGQRPRTQRLLLAGALHAAGARSVRPSQRARDRSGMRRRRVL